MSAPSQSELHVLIIGGGVSGLSAAYYLQKAGVRATLIERSPSLGGVVRTDRVDGCLIEAGPDSFLSVKPAALDLICELSLSAEVIGSNDHVRVTYIVKDGRLMPMPDGLMLMVPTRLLPMVSTPLLSWKSKFAMVKEYFRKPACGGAEEFEDRSVGEFIRDHYGEEAVEYLAEPLLSGVYGGSPERLSVLSVLPRFVDLERQYGSLTRGVLANRKQAVANAAGPLFRTLRGGLGEIVRALEDRLKNRTQVIHEAAETVRITPAGEVEVRVGGSWLRGSHVVVATPAWQAARVLAELAPELARELSEIEYSSSMTVGLIYDRKEFGRKLKGFGFLVPRWERRLLVACTFLGNKFSFRVPPDKVVLRCFLGGAGGENVLNLSDEEVLGHLRDEVARLLGVTAAPRSWVIHRWPRAMAQYTVGHTRRMARVRELLKELPRLQLAGNAYSGIGVPDCIRTGQEAALRIARPQ